MTPIEFTFYTSHSGPLNKFVDIDADGKLRKQGKGNMSSGIMERIVLDDWRNMAQGLPLLNVNQAISLGRLRPGITAPAYLTTAGNTRELALPGRYARTQENIVYASGVPAFVAIDFDTGGMPDSVKKEIDERGGPIAAIESICPALGSAAYLSRGSTTSGITIEATGERIEGGEHHFVVLAGWLVVEGLP